MGFAAGLRGEALAPRFMPRSAYGKGAALCGPFSLRLLREPGNDLSFDPGATRTLPPEPCPTGDQGDLGKRVEEVDG
jgi:hypothetical protein